MKRAFLCIFLVIVSGCGAISPTKQIDKNQKVVEKQVAKLDLISGNLDKNGNNEKNQIKILAAGTAYSLSGVTNPPLAVVTASKLNERIVSIVGQPNLDESTRIKQIVDLLNSAVAEENARGLKLLNLQDQIIVNLQRKNTELESQYDSQVNELNKNAAKMAKTADANQSVINSINGYLGLSAVFYGLKRFVLSSFLIIVVCLVVFVGLRVGSVFFPPVAALFSVFDVIGASILGSLKLLTPGAFKMSKMVTQAHSNKYKNCLVKIVDKIQELKIDQEKLPNKTFTLNEILSEFNGEMDTVEKDTIDQLLVELKWNK